MIELGQKYGAGLSGFTRDRSLEGCCARLRLRNGVVVLVIGMSLALAGCAKELTPYGRARETDTIASYEEFIRTNPRDPRVRYARQRVEALRLLEAQRNRFEDVAGAVKMAPQERNAVRPQPRNVQPGPWNLPADIPRRSVFTLDLQHGGITPIPHKLTISQEGARVTYSLEYGNESRLTALVPLPQFARFWETVVFSDVGSMQSSYGRMASTGDYRGYLVIEIDTVIGQFSREIMLQGIIFTDQNLMQLLNSMTQMHPRDHRMPLFR